MRKIEIIYTIKGEHKTYLLSDGPFMIGRSSVCQVQSNNSSLDISVMIQQNDEGRVVVTSADDNLAFVVNEKIVNKGIFNKDTFFKIGDQEFWFSFTYEQEIQDSDKVHDFDQVVQDDFTEDTQQIVLSKLAKKNSLSDIEESSDETETETETPDVSLPAMTLPDFRPAEELINKEETQEIDQQEDDSVIMPVSSTNTIVSGDVAQIVEQSASPLVLVEDYDDAFEFNTKFDESGFNPTTNTRYNDHSYSYENYVELEDDRLLDEDGGSIALESEDHALHVVYMNNGVVLNEDYFNFNTRKIYISNTVENKSTFKVQEVHSSKANLSYIRDGVVMVNRQDGFLFHRTVIENKMEELDQDFVELHEGEKIILTKGSTQVILRKTMMPPQLITDKALRINPELARYLGSFMMLLFPLIFLMVTVESAREELPKKETVVIYKLKKPVERVAEKPIETPKPIERPQPEEINKAQEQVSERKVKTVEKEVKKTPPRKKVAKETPKKVAKVKTKVAKAAPKKSPVKKSKKSVKKYAFNSASKFNALLGSKLATASNKQADKAQVTNSLGAISDTATTTKVNLNSNSNSVSMMKTEGIDHGAGNGGVRGLSSKTGTNFAQASSAAKVLGAIDPEIVRKLLREHIPYFRACYQKELRLRPELGGVFDLNFAINSKGRGVKVSIKTKKARFSKKGVNCMQGVVSMIQFPKPKGGGFVEVRQPLNFFSNRL